MPIWLIIAWFVTFAAGQEQPREPEHFLTKYLGFSHDQILQIERGAVVAKILKREKHEVAAVGVVRLNVPQEFFVARFRDIERHKKGEAVLQVRKLGGAPQAEDFADLTLAPREVRDLKTCRTGQCQLKLSRPQIELIQHLDFADPVIEEQANTVMRSLLADYAREYVAGGNKAMIVYEDKGYVVETATQFGELLKRSPYLLEYAPEFLEHLRDSPSTALEGVERFLYWSKENYGHDLRPVIAITDVIMYQRPDGNPPVVIASKQIYASHYFEASLGLTMLFERSETDAVPGFYLVYVNRSRIDLLRKWYSIFGRGSLSDSVRASMRKNLSELRTKVEAEYSEQAERHRRLKKDLHHPPARWFVESLNTSGFAPASSASCAERSDIFRSNSLSSEFRDGDPRHGRHEPKA